MKIENVTAEVGSICDRNRDALLALVRLLSEQSEKLETCERDEQSKEVRRAIEQIRAKEFASANEAAILFGCSPQHLRNLVQKAVDGETEHPIPFRDLDGVVVFPIPELLEWSRMPKPRTKNGGRKNRSTLRALA
jgi:hypothetical protein